MAYVENGIDFFIECFQLYWNRKYIIPIMFFAALFFMVITKRKDWRVFFLYPFLFAVCTIFNPLLMEPILSKFNWYNRYYRFYWIVPVSLVVALVLADIGDRLRLKILKLGFMLAVSLMICTYGEKMVMGFDGWNAYLIDSNVIDISKIIHTDTTEENPIVFYDEYLVIRMRQYDPSLISVLDLFDWDSQMLALDQVYDGYIASGRIFRLLGNYGAEVDPQLVNSKLRDDNVDYFVRRKGWFSEEYLQALNIVKIGESNQFEVYRVET